MATTERGLLMRPPLLSLDPTPMLRLIHGTATTERGLLMKEPLPPLGPTPMLRLTPGTDTTATATGHMAMDIMVLATVATTGDKKWSSTTTSDLFLPTHL